jgi:serine-type D-Ala-D-Ala carboxypeptidase/endopeptidase (penicillin-binding protein 4)
MLSAQCVAAASARAPVTTSRSLSLEARWIVGADQGVFVQSEDGTVLLEQAGARAVHPASISKVPTTLALLRKYGPAHRFVTTISSRGQRLGTRLTGDLVVQSDGDPFLVDEDALLIGGALQRLGIRQIEGGLVVRSPLMFDWQDDLAGRRLAAALSGHVTPAALEAVRAAQAHPGSILFAAEPGRRGDLEQAGEHALIVHRSQPLLALVKSLNDYSNNVFRPLAEQAGGAAAVEALARSLVPEPMRAEITLGDGAGTDPRNRLSPRATVQLLAALQAELARTGHQLTDVLPVAGIDEGTLHDRMNGPDEAGRVVGKTGTFGDYGASALAGALRTPDHGIVYFAILNHDVPVPEARRRQDRFVRTLLHYLHALPWEYRRDPRPAFTRVEVIAAS